MRRSAASFFCLAASLTAPVDGHAGEADAADAVPPDSAVLTAEIRASDIALFAAVFDTCDIAALKPMLADDLEFYHDKGGVVARTSADFIAAVEKNCDGRRDPGSYRSRRELVDAALHVDPIPGYGAMETGEHRFYERKGDGPEKLVGVAGFSHVWTYAGKRPAGRWLLSRVLSYGHRPVP